MKNIQFPEAYREFTQSCTRFQVLYGGAGSGKSHSIARKIMLRAVSEESHKFLICRKVARTLRVSVFQLFRNLIYEHFNSDDFKVNKSDMTITYLPNNSTLLFFGLDDIEKLKSIEGITSIWVEEASECERNDMLELNRRLRGITSYPKEFYISFNPISHLHWLKEHFFDNPFDAFRLKTTYKDNPFIDDEYKKEIEDIKSYDIQQYNIYALGEWGVLNTNIVYHKFDFTKHLSQKSVKDFKVLHVGIDFNVGGCACVVFGESGDEAYCVDFFAPYDTEAIVTELHSRYKNKELILYPDSSGRAKSTNASRSDIDILKEFRMNAPPKNGAVRDRINSVNRRFAFNKLFINKKLDKVIYSLQTQAYKENGEPEKFNDHKGGSIDDINDAFGYFIVRRYGLTRPKIGTDTFIMR